MKNILSEIIEHKKKELEQTKQRCPLADLEKKVKEIPKQEHSFKDAIYRRERGINIIAEIKKASPSKGILKSDLDVASFARMYEKAGVSAISVLTEEAYFSGSIEHLEIARKVTGLPLLRKDFIIDLYQLFETKRYGADAVLLIVAALDDALLKNFLSLAKSLNLDALVEVHTRKELERALFAHAEIIGINNRSLEDFSVHLDTTEELASFIPHDKVIVSESGIYTRADVERLQKCGVHAILVGEAIVTSNDPLTKIRELKGK